LNNNVSIEPLNEQHLPFVQKHASNPLISKTSNVPFPYPENGAEEWYEFIKGGVNSGKCKVFAILNNREFCGVITLNDIQIEKQSAQIDYWLAVQFHNQGITTKAVKAVIEFAYETLSICNFYSGGLKKNFASCKVLEKNGFSEIGTFVMSEGKFKGEEIRQFALCKSL
jgi:RimJ/RimL family protein N-acetyltransferase